MSPLEHVPTSPKDLVTKPSPAFHHTRGVYLNGEFKSNGVDPDHLASHIEYNLTMRPGRAFFVDGLCVHKGYLSEERCKEIEASLVGVTATKCTAPYH
jgi:hypothetical protein